MFLNETDKEMYEFLFVLKNGTKEDIIQWLDSHPIPEEQQQQLREAHKNQTREEKTAALIEVIGKIEDHINKTYFTGGEQLCTM